MNRTDIRSQRLGEKKILAPNYQGEDREAILKAILTPTVLSQLYTDYNGSPLPPEEHFLNVLENRYNVPRGRTKEARNIILENAKFAGILVTDAGEQPIHKFS